MRYIAVDLEAKPGPWGGDDFTFRSILSVASMEEGKPKTVQYLAPGFDAIDLEDFLQPLLEEGVCLVAHNGPRYDWPFLSGSRIKLSGKALPPLLISDTYAHLPKRGQAFSASLGNMAQRFGVSKKGSMGEFAWERVYAGDPEYLALLRKYNIQDVKTTLELRRVLVAKGLLGPPRVWRP